MPWVRLDDEFPENPKIARLSDSALSLWVVGLAYCNRNLTDGFIPEQVGIGQLRYCGGKAKRFIAELERTGIWEQVDGGWQVHDFHDYQPTREQVERDRELGNERVKRFRARKRNGASNAVTNGVSNGPGNGAETAAPVPVPEPTPSEAEEARVNGSSTLPFEKQLQVSRMLGAINNADVSTPSVIQSLAMPLPLASLVKVRESVERQGSVGAGYVVNALKSEREETAA